MPATPEGLRRERPGRSSALHFGIRGGCMSYAVKSLFYTIQGEGANVGRPAVFCRFAGCNLWTGREEDRHKAICQFCDTEFVGGEKYIASALATAINGYWPGGQPKFVVFTGGEPLLQLDSRLCEMLHWAGFEIAVETNGTRLPPRGVDWLTFSPKANAPTILDRCDELKLVYPQPELMPEVVRDVEARVRWLQPMD